jgi:hypothetical protein
MEDISSTFEMILYRYSEKGRRKLLHNVRNIPIT